MVLGNWAVYALAIVWLALVVGGGEYHLRHFGQPESWRLFDWTIAAELSVLVLALLPYTIANHPPLYVLSLVPSVKLLGPSFLAGRLVSIACTLASAFFLAFPRFLPGVRIVPGTDQEYFRQRLPGLTPERFQVNWQLQHSSGILQVGLTTCPPPRVWLDKEYGG